MSEFNAEANSVTFWLRVKPRSRRQRLGRISSDSEELFLQVTAPPVDQKANEEVIEFFADALGLPRSSIEILAGGKARRKLVRVSGRPAKDTIERLNALARKRAD